MRSWEERHCAGDVSALELGVPTGFPRMRFSELARLEIEVSEELPDPFPFPPPGSRVITQADFPHVIAAVRRQNQAEFGLGADRPERDAASD
jgi:hypothetical protein